MPKLVAFERISYQKLNSRQREAYNFQKLSAVLADYGFLTIRLSNDWRGADFIAQHFDGIRFLKVQLKGRPAFAKKYCGRDLYICFPHDKSWYLYRHDDVLNRLLKAGMVGRTRSWHSGGAYSFPRLTKHLEAILRRYRIS